MKLLITGGAGFIGFHLASRLIQEGFEVICIDSINNYYEPMLKLNRLRKLGFCFNELEYNKELHNEKNAYVKFIKLDIADQINIFELFEREKFDCVINLAAQAGVRYSLIEPHCYVNSNITGFLNILEACRRFSIRHLIYASSSSVYGLNKTIPFSEKHNVDHPASLYATTKKANELMAHTYSHLFGIPTTGLRFFTVYGPWGRPDMAYFNFTERILKGIPIDIYNYGNMKRDFTYIDDIVEGIVRLINYIPIACDANDNIDNFPNISSAPYRVFNIGNNQPVQLKEFVSILEEALGKTVEKRYLPIQPGDVVETFADIDSLNSAVGFRPITNIKDGLAKFVEWYTNYYKVF